MDAASVLDFPTAPRLAWRTTPVRLAALLGAIALALRCVGLGNRPPWLDEAYTFWFASRSWAYLWTVVPAFEPHPPFYYSLIKLWSAVAGHGLTALRGLSVLLGVAAVPVTIAAAHELERLSPSGRPLFRIGLAGFVTACAPMLVGIAQDARPYPLLVLAYSVALLGLLRLAREFDQGAAGRLSSWLILAGGTSVTLWAHATGVLEAFCLGAAMLMWLARESIDAARLRRAAAAGCAVLLLYLPCVAIVAARAGDWGHGWLGWEPGMMLELVGLYTIPNAASLLGAPLILAVALLAIRAARQAFRVGAWNADKAVLLLWLGPPLLSALVSALAVPIFLPRTLTPTIIPAALALSGAVARTSARFERWVVVAVLCLILPLAAVQTALRPAVEPWDQVGAFLRANVKAGDELWLYPNDTVLPLTVVGGLPTAKVRELPAPFPALGARGPVRGGSPAVVSLTRIEARALVTDPHVRRMRVVWLVSRQASIFDPNGDLPAALRGPRTAGAAHDWGYIRVQPYIAR